MARNTEIIDRSIPAWSTKDVDLIMSFFTPDAIYINVPIEPPNVGHEVVRHRPIITARVVPIRKTIHPQRDLRTRLHALIPDRRTGPGVRARH